jgi:hypothetical protein
MGYPKAVEEYICEREYALYSRAFLSSLAHIHDQGYDLVLRSGSSIANLVPLLSDAYQLMYGRELVTVEMDNYHMYKHADWRDDERAMAIRHVQEVLSMHEGARPCYLEDMADHGTKLQGVDRTFRQAGKQIPLIVLTASPYSHLPEGTYVGMHDDYLARSLWNMRFMEGYDRFIQGLRESTMRCALSSI